MNALEELNIDILEQSKKKVVLAFQVKQKHLQPYGMMHGGYNGLLIETACSLGANENIEKGFSVGLQLEVHHLKPAHLEKLIVIATPDQIGKEIQLWEGKIYNLDEKLISVGRVTLKTMHS